MREKPEAATIASLKNTNSEEIRDMRDL
jgi:hypothetical protein